MPTATPAVERLLEAVQKLSPAEYAEFTLRLGEWEGSADAPSEAVLIQRTKQQLPPADAKRLRALSRRSEQGVLTPADLDEAVMRSARALAELSRRRSQAVDQVKKEVGWREAPHGA